MSNRMGTFSNNLTEIIASALHYHDMINLRPSDIKTAAEIRYMSEEWAHRYKTDHIFNARVQSMAACIMQGMQHFIDIEVAHQVNHYINYCEEKS